MESILKSVNNIFEVGSSEVTLDPVNDDPFVFFIIVSYYSLTNELNQGVEISEAMEIPEDIRLLLDLDVL